MLAELVEGVLRVEARRLYPSMIERLDVRAAALMVVETRMVESRAIAWLIEWDEFQRRRPSS